MRIIKVLVADDDGAIADKWTVNAGAPAGSISGAYEAGRYAIGVGIDAQLALGDFHSLPTGDTDTRLFLYPHIAGGLPFLQATVGPLFPWYLGLGLRAHVPIFAPFELFASGMYGVPLDRPRADGQATFEPLPLFGAWGGATVKFGL